MIRVPSIHRFELQSEARVSGTAEASISAHHLMVKNMQLNLVDIDKLIDVSGDP